MKITGVISLSAIVVLSRLLAGAQIYDTNNDVAEVFAGSGTPGNLNGQGTLAMFNNPSQIVADTSSNLFVLDNANYLVRKITPDGTVSTFVGGGLIPDKDLLGRVPTQAAVKLTGVGLGLVC
jgi:hypothetical protein